MYVTMPRLSKDLRKAGLERTESECPICEEGVLWEQSHELVCDECGTALSKDGAGPSVNIVDPWTDFFEARTKEIMSDEESKTYTYSNNNPRLQGGFWFHSGQWFELLDGDDASSQSD